MSALAQTMHAIVAPLAPWALVPLLLLAVAQARQWRRASAGGVHVAANGIEWLWLAGTLALVAAGLTGMVASGDHPAVRVWDQHAAAWGASRRAAGWGAAAARLGEWTSGPPMAGLVLLAALGLALRRRAALAWGWLLATSINGLWVQAVKALVARPRPDTLGDTLVVGYSFPSGHSAGAMMVFGLLAWLLLRLAPLAVQWLGAALAGAIILAVGLSRIVLGVHYLTDVAAGFLWAAAWVACAVFALQPVTRQASRSHREF